MCKTINQQLIENERFRTGIDVLFNYKKKKKVFRKATEELAELLEKLIKRMNDPNKVTDEAIAEEVVDVAMHIELLQKYFDSRLLKGLVAGKVDKMRNSKDFRKYLTKQTEQINDETTRYAAR